ncbi:hypothetical protein LguiA_006388 [Lonicera macranthoides]
MKGRDKCKGASSTDLLVCFPSRAHLSLMPKPICSPSRPSEPNKQRSHHHHHKRSFSRGGGSRGAGGQASPMLWSKSRQVGSDISEPTSPKVTCAGQIKVRPRSGPRPGSCKNWRSVMEEIEKLHNERKQKRLSWVEALGIKKDAMQFLACLRNIRFDFRCFGSFPTSDIITSDDDEEDEDDEEEEKEDEASRTVFSKWFMVLQENQGNGLVSKENSISVEENSRCDDVNNNEEYTASAPPSNALLLMRCRSAPAKSWIEEREEDRREEERKEKLVMDDDDEEEEEMKMKMKTKRDNLVVMRYYENNNDFYKISSDIAKETWVVGGIKDPLSRSRSSKR